MERLKAENRRKKFYYWIKKLGWLGVLFFFLKGLVWLAIFFGLGRLIDL